MKILICGGGKVGFYLAKTLREDNYEIAIIERDKEQCKFCANHLDAAIICGDGTTLEVLEQAEARQCDAVVAVTGRDEDNLVCCQIAKKIFDVPKTVAKVNNPKNAQALKTLGVDIAISATDSIIRLLEREVDASAIKELIPLNDGKASVLEITLPDNYIYNGKSLAELNMPQGSSIVCITRDNKIEVPRGQTQLQNKDILLIVAVDGVEDDVRRVLKLKN